MILKGQVSAIITENHVKKYLRSKDKDYVNKLIESLYEQDDEDIDPSHQACPICGSVHFKKNEKDKNGHQKLSGEVEIDTQYKSINKNGTRPQNMLRYSNKRGEQAAYRGISYHKVAIVCAVEKMII